MNYSPLVSIIIPSYNRANLLGETLDSILAQTYNNWECIIVDDGSIDNTIGVVENYKKNDIRFLLFERPNTKPKGANACRNLGLENVSGEYVVFFDSDDLMTPDHLEVKVNELINNSVDYVVTRTKYFNHDNSKIDKYYQFNQFPITPYNYIVQNINWLTYDIGIKRELAQSISFNEQLQSGQEYNYFSLLVFKSVKARFINQVVTLRRYHKDSIRSKLEEKNKLNENYFQVYWATYNDLKDVADSETKVYLMYKCISFTLECKTILTKDPLVFMKAIYKEYRVKSILYVLALLSYKLTSRGYFLKKMFRPKLKLI